MFNKVIRKNKHKTPIASISDKDFVTIIPLAKTIRKTRGVRAIANKSKVSSGLVKKYEGPDFVSVTSTTAESRSLYELVLIIELNF